MYSFIRDGKEIKVNHCGGEAQKRMERNGWRMRLRESYQESPEMMYDRLVSSGYKQVKIYWEGTMIRGIHDYFAFVKF